MLHLGSRFLGDRNTARYIAACLRSLLPAASLPRTLTIEEIHWLAFNTVPKSSKGVQTSPQTSPKVVFNTGTRVPY